MPHHVPEEPVLDTVSLLVVAPRRRRQDAIVSTRIEVVRQRLDERVTARQIRTIDASQHESAEADRIGPPVGLDTGDCRRSDLLAWRRGVGRAARPAQRFDQEPAEAEAGIVHLLSRRRVGQRHHEIDNRGRRDKLTHRLAMPVHHEAHRLIEHGGGEPAACGRTEIQPPQPVEDVGESPRVSLFEHVRGRKLVQIARVVAGVERQGVLHVIGHLGEVARRPLDAIPLSPGRIARVPLTDQQISHYAQTAAGKPLSPRMEFVRNFGEERPDVRARLRRRCVLMVGTVHRHVAQSV